MIVAALVLPETTAGMIEASTTRRPEKPRTRKPLVDHRFLDPGPCGRCPPDDRWWSRGGG